MLKKWDRELETRSEPLVKQVDQFRSFVLTSEMPKAIAYLQQRHSLAPKRARSVRMGSAGMTATLHSPKLPPDLARTEPPKEGTP